MFSLKGMSLIDYNTSTENSRINTNIWYLIVLPLIRDLLNSV